MTPAIVPMAPGEQPTEPGWYVLESEVERCREVVEVSKMTFETELVMQPVGTEDWWPISREKGNFIARIVLERIG